MARGASHPEYPATAEETEFPRWRQSVWVIALGAFMASFSMNFWIPFLPVYMQRLGAGDDAAALTWVGIASAGSGIGRLVSGPFWGVIADRYGRKAMFVRALFAATLSTLIAAAATEPWHVAVSWTAQGALSGFIPAAVALTSVSVPRGRLTGALGNVQFGQYAGNFGGPIAGAVLAALIGLRGAVLAGALVPAAAALIVLAVVPRDHVGPRRVVVAGAPRESRLTTLTGGLSVQLGIGLLVYFAVFMTSGLVRTAAPVALKGFAHTASVTSLTGITFAVGGLGSAIGALGLARLLRVPNRLRLVLTVVLGIAAAAHALLGLAGGAVMFIAAYGVAGLCQGAMMPAANTVIAASAPYERRGAAFGLASSVQALAFVAGPLGAAYFAHTSLSLGFVLLGSYFAHG